MRVSSLLGTSMPIILGWSALPSPAMGQWLLGVEVGADRFWGGSVERTGEHRSFRPYRPTTLGIGLERQGNRLAAGLQVHYAEASLGLEGEGAVGAVEGVFTLVSLSPELVYRITSLGPANRLRLHIGPLLDVWSIIDEESQTRLGFQSALSLDVPLGGRFGASVLAGVALTASPFETGQLGADYDLRALWRRRFALGLRYRL